MGVGQLVYSLKHKDYVLDLHHERLGVKDILQGRDIVLIQKKEDVVERRRTHDDR